MTAMRFAVLAVIGLTAALSLDCSGVTTPSSNKTETFSGTVTVNGFTEQPFSTSVDGEFSITITSLQPDPDKIVALAYGDWNNGACATSTSFVHKASANRNGWQSVFSRKGTRCFQVADPVLWYGTGDNDHLTRSETYTISVSHP